MRALMAILVILLGVAAVGLYLSAYIVRETEQAIVLQFGRIQEVKKEPGLYWKVPVVQTVEYFDDRILDLDTEPLEVNVLGKKRLKVDAFARYRIVEPLKFFQAARTQARARTLLSSILEDALRSILGSAELQDVVRDRRSELMSAINKKVGDEAQNIGVQVVDVRIKRADLPEENEEAIYERMNEERKQEAQDLRSRGAAAADEIRAVADRKSTVIRAEAQRDAEKKRGVGDAEKNRIFAEAFGRDPDFFAFYRSMQAYEKGLKSGDTRLVISPDSEFFRYFGDETGRNRAGGNSASSGTTP